MSSRGSSTASRREAIQSRRQTILASVNAPASISRLHDPGDLIGEVRERTETEPQGQHEMAVGMREISLHTLTWFADSKLPSNFLRIPRIMDSSPIGAIGSALCCDDRTHVYTNQVGHHELVLDPKDEALTAAQFGKPRGSTETGTTGAHSFLRESKMFMGSTSKNVYHQVDEEKLKQRIAARHLEKAVSQRHQRLRGGKIATITRSFEDAEHVTQQVAELLHRADEVAADEGDVGGGGPDAAARREQHLRRAAETMRSAAPGAAAVLQHPSEQKRKQGVVPVEVFELLPDVELWPVRPVAVFLDVPLPVQEGPARGPDGALGGLVRLGRRAYGRSAGGDADTMAGLYVRPDGGPRVAGSQAGEAGGAGGGVGPSAPPMQLAGEFDVTFKSYEPYKVKVDADDEEARLRATAGGFGKSDSPADEHLAIRFAGGKAYYSPVEVRVDMNKAAVGQSTLEPVVEVARDAGGPPVAGAYERAQLLAELVADDPVAMRDELATLHEQEARTEEDEEEDELHGQLDAMPGLPRPAASAEAGAAAQGQGGDEEGGEDDEDDDEDEDDEDDDDDLGLM